jgi:hypothetical protein
MRSSTGDAASAGVAIVAATRTTASTPTVPLYAGPGGSVQQGGGTVRPLSVTFLGEDPLVYSRRFSAGSVVGITSCAQAQGG